MATDLHHDKQSLEELIKASFGFAQSQFGMKFGNVRATGGGDPRDAALVARYSGSAFRFDIGRSEFELALAVLINFDKADLSVQGRGFIVLCGLFDRRNLSIVPHDGIPSPWVPEVRLNAAAERMIDVLEKIPLK